MNTMIDEYSGPQRAVLVGLNLDDRNSISIEDSMDELAELAKAAGASVCGMLVQNKSTVEAATFIGKGKVDEVRLMAEQEDADLVIFNDELSGAQIRNLEALIDRRVIDRTALILDIFAQRARTGTSKLQVELAQLRYSLPRLTGLGASLSRTGGGIGTRGPGEQKLEMDRRRIRDRITDIRRQLDDEKKNRETQRSRRQKSSIPIVALVGYTNAGKSTVMNHFILHDLQQDADKTVFEKDMLFATLDTFHRRIYLEDRKDFILIDTVGFVSKLPHALVQAFKATLEEVAEADLLLQVVDVSNPNWHLQMQVTQDVLKELGVQDRPMVYLFNKIDKLDAAFIVPHSMDGYGVSAKLGTGIPFVMERLKKDLFNQWRRLRILVPYTRGDVSSRIHEQYTVYRSEYQDQGILMDVELDEEAAGRYQEWVSEQGAFSDEGV